MLLRARFLLTSLALLLVSVGFALGVAVRGPSTDAPLSDVFQQLQHKSGDTNAALDEVWKAIHEIYVETNVDDTALLHGALAGLVGALGDPYSSYLDPIATKEFEDEIDGTFEGVGMEVGFKNEQLSVIAPLPESPAAKAGLKAGDRIIAIDQTEAAELSLSEAIDRIRGPKGTTVSLTISREGLADPKTIKVTREKIVIEPVIAKVMTVGERRIGYIQIANFNEQTNALLRQYLRELLGRPVDGFVLDLRNNPGGLLDQSVAVASAFIRTGVIVSEVGRDGEKKELMALGNAVLPDEKIVVLVNGGSASASEIVAGALQDTGRAILVGEQTFGKGTVQDYRRLPDGASLKLTVAKWYTPKGRSINDDGITPDIVVTRSEADFEAGRDPQLDKALTSVP